MRMVGGSGSNGIRFPPHGTNSIRGNLADACGGLGWRACEAGREIISCHVFLLGWIMKELAAGRDVP
jgi:hypothetical protein